VLVKETFSHGWVWFQDIVLLGPILYLLSYTQLPFKDDPPEIYNQEET